MPRSSPSKKSHPAPRNEPTSQAGEPFYPLPVKRPVDTPRPAPPTCRMRRHARMHPQSARGQP